VRDDLATILSGLADLPIQRLPELTPKAWVILFLIQTICQFPSRQGIGESVFVYGKLTR
jgi:hypothetical protein